MSQLTLEQSLQGIRGIADDEERCRPSTLAAAVPAPHADPKGNYCKCVVCGKRMPKKSGERCDAQTLQLHYFAVDCPHLKQTTREQRVTYAHFCSVDCQTKIKMPPLQQDVREEYVSDMRARFEVGRIRIRDRCSRASAIERAGISQDHRDIMANPGGKTLCSPHMIADPKCRNWVAKVRTASSIREAVYIVVMLVLFSLSEAVSSLERSSLLHLRYDESWEERFRAVAAEIPKFTETITKQDSQNTTADLNIDAVCEWRKQTLSSSDFDFENLRGKALRNKIEQFTSRYMSFGEFKAYVACKVLGYACPGLYNVSPLGDDFRVAFEQANGEAQFEHLKAKLKLNTLQTNDIVVGPHCRDHLLRAFGLPPCQVQKISLPRLRTLLARHFVELYAEMENIFGLSGFGMHDDEHASCEAEKFNGVRLAVRKRSRPSS